MKHVLKTLVFSSILSVSVAQTALAAPKVVASIKPIHGLVSMIMGDVGKPDLILRGFTSPHRYNLLPSDASALQSADLIFWAGPGIESFLVKPIENLSKKSAHYELMEAPGVELLAYRESDDIGHDDHDDHDHGKKKVKHDDHDDHDHGKKKAKHDDHDDHDHGKKKVKHDDHDDHDHGKKKAKHDDHDDHDHGKKKVKHDDHDDHDHGKKEAKHDDHDDHDHGKKKAAAHDDHHDHDHGEFDAHFWLDPDNAAAALKLVAAKLSEVDAANKATYEANLKKALEAVHGLEDEIEAVIKPAQGKKFIVFHDAYQYFEKRFDLDLAGVVSLNPEVPLGARRLKEVQETVKEGDVVCAFSEPQFNPASLKTISQGVDVKLGELDPQGAGLPAGADHYRGMMLALANSFATCLK